MIFWLAIIGTVATYSFQWAIFGDDKVERILGAYIFIVTSGLFIYSLMKAGIL
jgi:hypothetical protein